MWSPIWQTVAKLRRQILTGKDRSEIIVLCYMLVVAAVRHAFLARIDCACWRTDLLQCRPFPPILLPRMDDDLLREAPLWVYEGAEFDSAN